MKVSKNFVLQEFVPPEIYKKIKKLSVVLLDPVIIDFAQFLRDRFACPVYVNTWHLYGEKGLKYRGWRPHDCEVGAQYSLHKYGRAIDLSMDNYSPIEIYKDVVNNFNLYKDYITTTLTVEKTENFNHFDRRYVDSCMLNVI